MWQKENWKSRICGVGIGLIIAYAITVMGILFMAFLLYQWRISSNAVEIGVLLLYFLSCLTGGFIAGKKVGNRKFLWGFFLGCGYFLILLILSLTEERMMLLGKEIFLPGVICILSGMLGGMFA